MKTNHHNHGQLPAHRSVKRHGFTLVEMLVAVGLVVLMMTMFAQIFSMATGSMTQQRAVSHNNQRARTFMTLLKTDLEKRTFRNVVPFYQGEATGNSPTSFGDRAGYFYISENNPDDDTDNVLQFTSRVTIQIESKTTDRYYGKATSITDAQGLTQQIWNEPDVDDGRVGDNMTTSSAAEIAYFMRGKKLYRRVLLLREPLVGDEPNPTDNQGTRIFDPANAGRPLNLWNDFDSSMFDVVPRDPDLGVAEFNGLDALDNSQASSLGLPYRRFGFFRPTVSGPNIGTRPMEHLSSGEFFGRFTQEETSHNTFAYPHHADQKNPLAQNLTLNAVDGSVSQFRGGPRKGEDILLTNVLSFAVEVWDGDHNGGSFVRLGRGNQLFTRNKRLNQFFGDAPPEDPNDPNSPPMNWIFDTWHPEAVVFSQRSAPFRPMIYDDRLLDKADPTNEPLIWTPNETYSVGDWVFPTDEAAGYHDTSDPMNLKGPLHGYATRFVCVRSDLDRTDNNRNDNLGQSGQTQPPWIYRSGEEIEDGTVIWRAEPNVLPLRAIRITVRFMHPTSDEPRQITIVQSLID